MNIKAKTLILAGAGLLAIGAGLKYSGAMYYLKSYLPQKFSRPHLIFEATFEPGTQSAQFGGFDFSGNRTIDIVSNDKIATHAA